MNTGSAYARRPAGSVGDEIRRDPKPAKPLKIRRLRNRNTACRLPRDQRSTVPIVDNRARKQPVRLPRAGGARGTIQTLEENRMFGMSTFE